MPHLYTGMSCSHRRHLILCGPASTRFVQRRLRLALDELPRTCSQSHCGCLCAGLATRERGHATKARRIAACARIVAGQPKIKKNDAALESGERAPTNPQPLARPWCRSRA